MALDGRKPKAKRRKPKRRLQVIRKGEDPPKIGPPPTHLCDLAVEFWLQGAAALEAQGCDPVARFELECAAVLYATARRAEAEVERVGAYFISRPSGNPTRHPAALEAVQCRKELRIVTESLGLSAIGRA